MRSWSLIGDYHFADLFAIRLATSNLFDFKFQFNFIWLNFSLFSHRFLSLYPSVSFVWKYKNRNFFFELFFFRLDKSILCTSNCQTNCAIYISADKFLERKGTNQNDFHLCTFRIFHREGNFSIKFSSDLPKLILINYPLILLFNSVFFKLNKYDFAIIV